MARDVHPDWLPRPPGTPPSPRPKGASDAERALWWRTRIPTPAEVDAWMCQYAFDVCTARWPDTVYLDYSSPVVPAAMMVLPPPAFAHPGAQRLVSEQEDAPPGSTPPDPDRAWSAFSKPLCGHAEPWRRHTLRASLVEGELPDRADQIVCNRVLREIHLYNWLLIAVEEGWTIERLAEITRNAGSSSHHLCTWLNAQADVSLCPPLDPRPPPETPAETWHRCWYQPVIHATSGPEGDLSCYAAQQNEIRH